MHPSPNRLASALLVATAFALDSTALAGSAACGVTSSTTAPTVVELYTSEGCSSCPPADRWLSSLKGRPGIVSLAFHVDYWDRLGWKDRFADPAYTQRQHEVSARAGARFVYTPQVLVDGADYRDWPGLPRAVSRPATVQISLSRDGAVYVARLVRGPDAPTRMAAFWVVTEDSHVSHVKSGENRGVTLHHDAVVRDYRVVPTVGEAPLRFEPRPNAEPSPTRRVQLVVTDAVTGRPLQAAGC